MKKLSLLIVGLILTGLLANTQATHAEIPVFEWARQLGTTGYDIGYGVSVDASGNAYVTGYTPGSLDGNTSAGGADMFLAKYDPAGNKQWTRQLGTSRTEVGKGVSIDISGNAYVTGYTWGDLDGNTNAGYSDMFLTKYDTDGTKQWTEQLGTAEYDRGYGVSLDSSGNAYVTGETRSGLDGNTHAGGRDIFLTKYNTDGAKQWTRQLGTAGHDYGAGVSVDISGNAYVTGYTPSDLDGNTSAGGDDMFLTKYDTAGAKQWTEQLGTSSYDWGYGVSVDSSGNAYVTGGTAGGLDGNANAGPGSDLTDMFLTKYNTNGAKQWTRQLGAFMPDIGYGVSVDASGNAYVTGCTFGGLDGNTHAGVGDMFLTKYDTDGNKLWTCQLGTGNDDIGYGVSVDASGNAYVTGGTEGVFPNNTNAGSYDMVLVKISSIPEPSTLALLCMGALGLLAYGWRKKK